LLIFCRDALILNFARIIVTPLGVIIFSYNSSHLSPNNGSLILFTLFTLPASTEKTFLTLLNSLNEGYMGSLLCKFFELDEKLTTEVIAFRLFIGFVILLMLCCAGYFPGSLIKGRLSLVLLSCIFHFIFLQRRELWTRASFMFKSKHAVAASSEIG